MQPWLFRVWLVFALEIEVLSLGLGAWLCTHTGVNTHTHSHTHTPRIASRKQRTASSEVWTDLMSRGAWTTLCPPPPVLVARPPKLSFWVPPLTKAKEYDYTYP